MPKKIALVFSLVFLLLLICSPSLFAANEVKWFETTGPIYERNMEIYDVEVADTNRDIIYLLAKDLKTGFSGQYFILKSIDGGTSWMELTRSRDAFRFSVSDTAYNFTMHGIKLKPGTSNVLYAWGGSKGPSNSEYYGGVWASYDGGENWYQKYGRSISRDLIEGCYTDRFTIAPSNYNYLYKAVSPFIMDPDLQGWEKTKAHFLAVSNDGGTSWKETSAEATGLGLDLKCGIQYFSVHPTNESVVIASVAWQYRLAKSTGTAGIFISTNECQSFTLLKSDFPGWLGRDSSYYELIPFITSVDFDPDDPENIRVVKAAGYWYPTTEAYPPPPPRSHVSPEVYFSNDSGNTWSTIEVSIMYGIEPTYFGSTANTETTYIVNDPNNFNRLYYVGRYLWRSDDGGQNWFNNAPITDTDVPETLKIWKGNPPSGSQYLYGTKKTDPWLRVNSNYGLSQAWVSLNDNLIEEKLCWGMAANPNHRGNVIVENFGIYYRTTDYGSNWAGGTPSQMNSITFDPNNKGVAWADNPLGTGAIKEGLYKTTDSGATWQKIGPEDNLVMIKCHPTDSEILYRTNWGGYGSTPKFLKSTNGGYNWDLITETTIEVPFKLVIDPVSPEVMYGTADMWGLEGNEPYKMKGIWKSTNSGAPGSWTKISDSNTMTVSAIAIDPEDPETIYVGTGRRKYDSQSDFGEIPGSVYRSTNGGSSWTPFGGGALGGSDVYVPYVFVDPVNTEKVYALFYPLEDTTEKAAIGRVWIDNQDIWIDISTPSHGFEDQIGAAPHTYMLDMDNKKGTIVYAGTANGLYYGIDYDEVPTPEITALWPPLGSNYYITPLQIYGAYFIDVNRAFVKGPYPATTITQLNIQSYNPSLINTQIPDSLDVGTYEVIVETKPDPPGTTVLTSEAAIFDVITQNANGPMFEVVRFDGLAYSDLFVPQPVTRSPLVAAEIYDEKGINEEGFGYKWINTDRPYEQHQVDDQSEFTYTSKEVSPSVYSTIEGTVTFTIDPPWQPGNYQLIIEARDKEFTDAFPEGNPNFWYGDLQVEVGPLRVLGNILGYPSVFKPVSEGPTTIAYNLSRNADTTIYIFDVSGQVVLTRKFSSGTNGGRVGYNDFEWNGVSDIGGGYIGNGIYLIQVTSGGKDIGRGKLVVFE